VGFDQVVLDSEPARRLWCHVYREDWPDPASLKVSARLFDDDGRPRGFIDGMLFRRIDASFISQAGSRSLMRHVYRTVWHHEGGADGRTDESMADARPASRRGTWLIAGDPHGLGSRLGLRIERAGGTYTLIDRDAIGAPGGAYTRDVCDVVDLLLSDAPESNPGQSRMCGEALTTVQALARLGLERAPRLWLVSRRAQPASVDATVWPEEATLTGFARVVANEHPEFRCTHVDVDSSGIDEQADALFRLLWSDAALTEVALRSAGRYVPRLVRHVPADPASALPIRLERSANGLLSELHLRPAARRTPGPGQVEVRVRAAGLNFRDVLAALGQYPGEVPALGGEFSGVVVAVGPGVTEFKPGDAVAGIAPGSFSTFATTLASLVAHKPANVTFEEAATIPIVFLTGSYVLHHIARIQPGNRVLIHAAAGGVGHAVIQLAQLAGAEIFATAGSPAKREYVKGLGAHHVMNSRTTHFHDEILASTNGEGVDVVVNSLTGAFIPKSLAVIRAGGTFLEIGKLETWTPDQVAEVNPRATYQVFALEQELQEQETLLSGMLRTIFRDVESGRLRPLPLRCFPIDDAASAFRYMAQARHVGKVVLTFPTADYPNASPDGTILVTGGTGAIARHLTRWLVGKGATRVVLVSRHAADSPLREQLQPLVGSGADITFRNVDVSDQAALARLFSELDAAGTPVKGVFHAAGVLDDTLIAQQTWPRFRDVLAPKVDGAWNLHVLTRNRVLDYFVLFSSGATVLGSIGQSSYAAANAFMDALAYDRRAHGLPALSVNWGPWHDTGMAASTDGKAAERWNVYGIETIDPDAALECLGRLMNEPVAHAAVMPVRWPDLARRVPGDSVPTLLGDLLRQADAPAARPFRDIRAELARAYPAERRDLVVAFVHDEVARVLGLGPAQALDPHQALSALGLDSLMVVELRNALNAATGQALPAGIVFQYPTIDAVAGYVFGLLEHTAVMVEEPAPARGAVHEIEALSERELDDRLNRLLDEHGAIE
jgi:NADPH:quinone reductase-like Zn-dependent oxidoreductase